MKNQTKIALIIFITSLIIRIIFVFSSPTPYWDETVYANIGYDLSRNPFDYSLQKSGWSDFIPASDDFNYNWPKLGFRAPLLPYSLSLLYLLNLDFFISFFMPIIGALSAVLVFYLGKKLFNQQAGVYSAVIFSLIPLHVIFSSKILTDAYATFFIILSFISFYKGYEENNKTFKIFFGFFLALALLARYTVLWIIPVFFFYFLIKDKFLKFLKDKYLWFAVLIFFLTLSPWFIYGISEYNNPFGAFIHGVRAASYWGGTQSWSFFFQYSWEALSIIAPIFLFSLFYIFYKKQIIKKQIYLLFIWFLFFLIIAMLMPHKETRFLMPIIPSICLLTGFALDKIKKYKNLVFVLIIIILFVSLSSLFIKDYNRSYTNTNKCFLQANTFLKSQGNIKIVTDQSSIVYYLTKQETMYYPPINLIPENYHILFSDYGMPLFNEENQKIKEELDSNFKKIFECSLDGSYSAVYISG